MPQRLLQRVPVRGREHPVRASPRASRRESRRGQRLLQRPRVRRRAVPVQQGDQLPAGRPRGGGPARLPVAVPGEDLGDLVEHPRRRRVRVGQVQLPGVGRGAVGRLDAQRDPLAAAAPAPALRRDRGRGRRTGDGAAARGQQVAGDPAQVRAGPVQQFGRSGAVLQQPAQLGADVLGQGEGPGRAAAEVAPLAQVHRLGHGAEAGPRGDGDDGHAVGAAGVHQLVGDPAVGLLAGEQGGGPGLGEGGDETVRLGQVAVRPPHQPAEHQFAGAQEAARVLQVGGGDPADLLAEKGILAPEQREAEGVGLEQVEDVHGGDSLRWVAAHIRQANTGKNIVNARPTA